MDLEKQLEFILDSEVSAYSQRGRTQGGLGTFNVGLQSVPNNGWTNAGSTTKYLFDEADADFIKSENASLILKLHASLETSGRKKLEKLLLEKVDRDNKYKDISYLVGFVFIRLGKLGKVVNKAVINLKDDSAHAYSNFLHMIRLVVAREYSYFHFKELSNINEGLKDDKEAQFALIPTLREACKRLLGQELDNQENPEVTEDLKNTIWFFNTNFPNEDIPDLIKHIEDLFRQGDFSDQSYATCVDRVRALIVSATRFLAIQKGIKNPSQKDDKAFGKFLYDNHHITEEEHELLKAFYTFCSNNGAHISKTGRNTARLVKNMGFELVALLSTYIK